MGRDSKRPLGKPARDGYAPMELRIGTTVNVMPRSKAQEVDDLQREAQVLDLRMAEMTFAQPSPCQPPVAQGLERGGTPDRSLLRCRHAPNGSKRLTG